MPDKSTEVIRPKSSEEYLIWVGIIGTYGFYLTGTLYVFGAMVGWLLVMIMLLRAYVSGRFDQQACIPMIVWVWVAGMFTMLVSLLVAHSDYNLSMGQTVKSSVGWAKGWALLALFPLIGAMIRIRPELISRACCILASHSMIFFGIGMAMAVIGFQGPLYLSPLKAIGGPISSFEVNLFGMNPETGRPRWPFFAPWAPAAGLMSCLLLIICHLEKNRLWRRSGMLGAFVMCLFCQSRAGWVIFIALIPALYCFKYINRPAVILAAGLGLSGVLMFGQPFFEAVSQAHQDIKDSRADSTRVRNTLANIAVQRWESEAPIWGHGIVERGPKIVEHMPIGSHHSWYGLLFVKGIVGLVALAVPMAFTFIYLAAIAFRNELAQHALLVMVVFIGYSFFENLEILVYVYWPMLIWLGIVLNPMKLKLLSNANATGVYA